MPWEPLPDAAVDPTRIDRSVERILRSIGGPGTDVLTRVFGSWNEVAGDDLAAMAQPESLTDGCLTVSVEDPAWVSEVRFRRQAMLERLASQLGPGAVTTIDVRIRR